MQLLPKGFRNVKQRIQQVLGWDDLELILKEISQFAAKQVICPLFGLLTDPSEIIRWRAATALGAVTSDLADTNMESARVIMRRFMWNLNDESGGIGWGCPESMGEATARHTRLANEYGRILVSYIDPDGNFLEHPRLQRGVLWGVRRLISVRPELIAGQTHLLHPFLASEDPVKRGLSLWIAREMKDPSLLPLINDQLDDSVQVTLYTGFNFETFTIKELAEEALNALPAAEPILAAT